MAAMDTNELKKQLSAFLKGCKKKGRAIDDILIEEAFPGDDSTSFIVKLKASWVDEMDCYQALDFLFDVLWDTTPQDVRKKVFSIVVLDKEKQLR